MGKSRFQWLQHFEDNPKRGILKFYVFDILYFNGFDLRPLELIQRKKILKALLPKLDNIFYSEHITQHGLKALEKAKQSGAEGIIAKRANSKYYSAKRSKDWLKIKLLQHQEMVIGGYTEPGGSRKGLGALLCGYYEGETLRYSGKVGTGFTESILKELTQKLEKLERKTSPFTDPPHEKSVHWVNPILVAQIKYSELTETNSMRHPVYLGLRPDKNAREVVLEIPQFETDAVAENKENMKKLDSGKLSNKENLPLKLTEAKAKELSNKVSFTNLDKIFWPKEKITKGHVISYYNEIADFILPHLLDRPESLRRTPDGLKSEGFFQKNVEGMVPKWIKTRKIKSDSKEESIEYMLCQDKDSLLFMANWGCIEINPWASRVGSINNPDFIIFDIDPKDAPLGNTIKTALKLKEVLDALNVKGFLKTSGGNGLHVFIPVLPKYSYEQTRNFSHLISQMVHKQLPGITSLERMPAKRKGKVYLDYLQNGRGKTMASIYSLRPRPNLGVSTPLDWNELSDSFDMNEFNYFTILPRLAEKGDLWKEILKDPMDLKTVLNGLR
ncbi:MAG: DNA ligase D [Saprospiraceae bacterium]|nr:DNA ligase D [Saprospiraceae bacterium]